MASSKTRIKKRTTIPTANGDGQIVRKSVGRGGFRSRALELEKNYGVTGTVEDLISEERINKGIFGFNDLTSFENRPAKGSFSMDHTAPDGGLQVVAPVFPFKQLAHLHLTSTTLRECVQAYVTNIEGYGQRIEYIGPEGKKKSRAAQAEYRRLTELLGALVQNGETLTKARENSRIDKEVMGARAFEVMEDAAGRVVGINRIPTNTLLMTRLDKEYTETMVWNAVTKSFSPQKRRFRRFVQRDSEGNVVFFKELGDPRPIDSKTGKVNPDLEIEDEATSIYYDGYYVPGSPYGAPQWASCIPSMMGAREAEHVNLDFFRDNAIPAMAVLVSGGALTEESFSKIESYFTAKRGRAANNRIVVLEASADHTEMAGLDGSIAAPKVDIKSMLSDRQHEGLFSQYIEQASEKIRQAMRLPPIYIGSAEEYNRASAFASMQTAEQQVFVPERLSWDRFMEEIVLGTWGFTYWTVRSATPSYNDPQEVGQLLTVLGNQGALTPNICISLCNRYLNTEIESVMEDWGDMPYSVTIAAIAKGAKVEGFEYVFEALADAAQQNKPQPGEDDSEEDSDVDPAESEEDDAEKQKKSFAQFFDEFAERGMREFQTMAAAA